MPRKIRQLLKDLEKAGFINRGGKGSHRNYTGPNGAHVTVSGQLGEDAHHYQERKIKAAIEKSKE